ncbi:MAG: hypothetical protein Q4C59_10305 [Lachnospiraceae bacterium]|nr:hypothetical protein [Lachnospiraceae bacterium]
MQEKRTNVIKLRYLRAGEPSGREYTFFTPEQVEIGDLVDVEILSEESRSHGIVTAVNVPYAEIEPFNDRARAIIGKTVQETEEDSVEKAGSEEKNLLDI